MSLTLDRRAYTIREIREMTGFSNETVYKHIRAGKLVARKCGRRTLILSRDLDKFLDGLPTLTLTDAQA